MLSDRCLSCLFVCLPCLSVGLWRWCIGAQPPIFGPCLLWPNGWMPFDREVDLGPSDDVLDGEPASPLWKAHRSRLFSFRPMSIVPKRSPISATAEHLSILFREANTSRFPGRSHKFFRQYSTLWLCLKLVSLAREEGFGETATSITWELIPFVVLWTGER